MPVAQARELEPVSGYVADAQHGPAADGTAFGFHMSSGIRRQMQAKAFPTFAQLVDILLEFLRRLRWQPGAEAKHPARRRCIGDERDVAFDVGLAIGRTPRNDDLRFGGQEHIGAVEGGTGARQVAR